MNLKELTIFGIGAGKDGQSTLMFYNVTNFEIEEEGFVFEYVSASTGQKKLASFRLANISGISFVEEGEE